MKLILSIILFQSCAFLNKPEKKSISYKVNQCLIYRGERSIIIDSQLSSYKLFYKFEKSMYVSDESKYYVHSRMIPVTCQDHFINDMNNFIKEKYSK
jgi:hypothetical protein